MQSYALKEIVAALGISLPEGADPEKVITGVKPLDVAGESEISFLSNSKYVDQLPKSQAGAVLLAPESLSLCPSIPLIIDNPYLGVAIVGQMFDDAPLFAADFIHPTAVVAETAKIGQGVYIGPHVVINDHAHIGDHVVIESGCSIGERVQMGKDTLLKPNVTVCHRVVIGEGCLIHSGAVLGSDGFGNAQHQGKWIKVPQLGSVTIGDDVEIGANSTIDRGAMEDTVIEQGVRIDNLVQVAHNVRIGAYTAIAAGSGIAGSTRIGKHCMLGGMVGVNGHIEIADGTVITGQSSVTNTIAEPGLYSATMPAIPAKGWRRAVARFHQLDKMASRLKVLEKLLKKDK